MAKTTTNDVRVIETTIMRSPLGGIMMLRPFEGDSGIGRTGEEVPCSLVIGDKAMPMSQVAELLREILIHERDVILTTWAGKSVPSRRIVELFAKYGVTLS